MNRTLQTTLQQAETDMKLGRYTSAEKMCHDVLANLALVESDSNLLHPADTESADTESADTSMNIYAIHCHALRVFSESLWRRGRMSEALTFAEDALALSRQSGLREEQAWSLGNLGNVYWSLSDFTMAMDFYRKAVHLFEELDIPAGMAKYLGNIGTIERNFYDFPAALSTYRRALHLYESLHDTDGIAINLGNIGLVYKSMSDYTRALEYYQKALVLYEEMNARDGIARTLCNVGTLYRNLSDYPRALDYLQKALVIFTELDDKQGVATNLSNIGNVYLSMSDLPQALDYHLRALTINQGLGAKPGIAKNLGNIGIIYSSLNDYARARDYYQQALTINEELGRTGGVAGMMCNIGALYAKKEYDLYNPDLAEEYLLKAISINEMLGTKQNLYESHLVLAELYRDKNQWDKFGLYFEKYHNAEKEVQSERARKLAERFDSERKFAAEHARLEERERVVAQLLSLNTSLKEANREKNEVLEIVAHDLKNPLTGILLSAESIRRFVHQLSPNDIEKRISTIITAAEHMKEIILKLLDIQLLENGRFQLATETVDLGKHAALSAAHFTDQSLAKRINVQLPRADSALVLADSNALLEVIDNLLSNAIKFSPFESRITMRISHDAPGYTCLRIIDHGPGLSAEDQSKLFGKFVQLSAKPTGGEHSTGLGLSIAKKLIEAMNGRIWCESTIGEGATFVIELPAG